VGSTIDSLAAATGATFRAASAGQQELATGIMIISSREGMMRAAMATRTEQALGSIVDASRARLQQSQANLDALAQQTGGAVQHLAAGQQQLAQEAGGALQNLAARQQQLAQQTGAALGRAAAERNQLNSGLQQHGNAHAGMQQQGSQALGHIAGRVMQTRRSSQLCSSRAAVLGLWSAPTSRRACINRTYKRRRRQHLVTRR
jgi:hypothetical protein